MKKKDLLIKAVKEILEDYPGMNITLRQAYYRLVAKMIIENTISQYKGLSRILVSARRNNLIPYDVFEDRTRTLNGNTGFGYEEGYYTDEFFVKSAIESLESALEPHQDFFYSRWHNQPYRVMVLCEKDALSNIFNSVCTDKNVHFAALRGYSSETLKHQIAGVLKAWISEDLKPIILYFGDFDPTGRDIPRDFKDALNILGVNEFQYKLCALTTNQIQEWKLPPAPAKKTDSRSKKFIEEFGDKSVELDAIEPKLLKSLIELEIMEFYDIDIYLKNKDEAKDRKDEINEKIKVAFKGYLENLDLSQYIE